MDAVESDLRRYLSGQDRQDRAEQVVEERVKSLLLDDYFPFSPSNIIEALGEIDITEEIAALFENPVKNPSTDAHVMEFLRGNVTAYWEKHARKRAEESVYEADCPHCFDQGCPKCDPDY